MKDIDATVELITKAFDPRLISLACTAVFIYSSCHAVLRLFDSATKILDESIKRLSKPHVQRAINNAVSFVKACIAKLHALPTFSNPSRFRIRAFIWFLIATFAFEVALFYVWTATVIGLSLIQFSRQHLMSFFALMVFAGALYKVGRYFHQYAGSLRTALTATAN